MSDVVIINETTIEVVEVASPSLEVVEIPTVATEIVEIGVAASGGGVWGAINGTLSDQVDLQTALNGKEVLGAAAQAIATHESTYPHAEFVTDGELSLAIASKVDNSDPRLTDPRTPIGAAGGVLAGTYPNPTFAEDLATQAELDAAIASIPPAPVQSVFGRAGDVVAETGDYNSDQVTEGITNLYFTLARSRNSLSATGPLAYDAATGAFSLPAAGTNQDGYFSGANFVKLGGIQAGATANSTDTFLLSRANHAGSQPVSTISDSTATGRSLVTATDAAAGRTALALGTMAVQNANSVAITGGAINGTAIGSTTANTGAFTTLSSSGLASLNSNLQVSGLSSDTYKIRIPNNLTPTQPTTSLDIGGTFVFNVVRTAGNFVAFRLNDGGSATFGGNLSAGGNLSVGDAATSKITFPNAWNVDKIIFRSDILQKISVDINGNFTWITGGKNFTFSDVPAFAIAGTLRIGNSGTPIVRCFSAIATLDFPSIPAQSSADLTITVTGAATGDTAILGLPASPTAGIVFNSFVSATNTVTIRATNVTAGAIDPVSASYRVAVLGF